MGGACFLCTQQNVLQLCTLPTHTHAHAKLSSFPNNGSVRRGAEADERLAARLAAELKRLEGGWRLEPARAALMRVLRLGASDGAARGPAPAAAAAAGAAGAAAASSSTGSSGDGGGGDGGGGAMERRPLGSGKVFMI